MPLGVFAEATQPDDPVPLWVDVSGSILVYWDVGAAGRRMPWQRGASGARYYAEQAAALSPNQFQRLHEKRWARSSEQFVPPQ